MICETPKALDVQGEADRFDGVQEALDSPRIGSEMKSDSSAPLFFAIIAFGAWLGFAALVIGVVWHFIAKFW